MPPCRFLIFLGKNFSQVVEIQNVLCYTKMNDNLELSVILCMLQVFWQEASMDTCYP